MNKQRIICFLGPQGSGKGTQAGRLAKFLSLPTVSTGSLYRSHVSQETSIGLEAKQYLDQGQYVPDSVTIQLIEETLVEPMYASGIILDGFPRTLPQKEFLDKKVMTYDVVYIDISDDEVIKRIAGRVQCPNGHIYHTEYKQPQEEGVCDIDNEPLSQRSDDTPDALKRRLENFHTKTKPLLEAYKVDGNLHIIDGNRAIDEVFADIQKIFSA